MVHRAVQPLELGEQGRVAPRRHRSHRDQVPEQSVLQPVPELLALERGGADGEESRPLLVRQGIAPGEQLLQPGEGDDLLRGLGGVGPDEIPDPRCHVQFYSRYRVHCQAPFGCPGDRRRGERPRDLG